MILALLLALTLQIALSAVVFAGKMRKLIAVKIVQVTIVSVLLCLCKTAQLLECLSIEERHLQVAIVLYAVIAPLGGD